MFKIGETNAPTTTSTGQRITPYSELDLTFLTTQPGWGREASETLQDAISKTTSKAYLKDGVLVIDKKPLWDILQFYTRDIRLGNLNPVTGEVAYCQTWLDLAGDCLSEDLVLSFLSCLRRVITLLELSQSKGGFLRKRQGTITSEQIKTETPNKNNLLGGKKNGN